MKEYVIEIHTSDKSDPFVVIESETPFMSISKGDLMDPSVFDQYEEDGNILRVVNVEHIIYGRNPVHKILVYTERTGDTQAARFS